MANKTFHYKGLRGSEYEIYVGRFWCSKCKKLGYAEQWKTWTGSRVVTVKHIDSKGKTIKRCWL